MIRVVGSRALHGAECDYNDTAEEITTGITFSSLSEDNQHHNHNHNQHRDRDREKSVQSLSSSSASSSSPRKRRDRRRRLGNDELLQKRAVSSVPQT